MISQDFFDRFQTHMNRTMVVAEKMLAAVVQLKLIARQQPSFEPLATRIHSIAEENAEVMMTMMDLFRELSISSVQDSMFKVAVAAYFLDPNEAKLAEVMKQFQPQVSDTPDA